MQKTSAFDSQDPEDLWGYMAGYEEETGGSVLAIPHNGNLSNGFMFSVERLNGQRIDKRYAETRMRWEPLYEVTQIKGDGEAHPKLSREDEFADYGTWDKGDILGKIPKQAPVFMAGALKDPQGANLDRIQIVKGWVDEKGKRHERIYDVACADHGINAKGRCDGPVGSTVDEKNATYLNNIGDAELRAVWTDPDFNPKHRAVCYSRVLEIPTPNWYAPEA